MRSCGIDGAFDEREIMKTQDDWKLESITYILDNPVYLLESGTVKRLTKRLMKMSLSDLQSLEMIVGFKVDEATDKAKDRSRFIMKAGEVQVDRSINE